jgi:hypothetical protein
MWKCLLGTHLYGSISTTYVALTLINHSLFFLESKKNPIFLYSLAIFAIFLLPSPSAADEEEGRNSGSNGQEVRVCRHLDKKPSDSVVSDSLSLFLSLFLSLSLSLFLFHSLSLYL